MSEKIIVAVDFDGTLCEDNFPYAGKENWDLIHALQELKVEGKIELILWSCRIGEHLDFAINWCKERGLIFDAVNSNLPRIIEKFEGDTRKIFANVYIDDLSTTVNTCNSIWSIKERVKKYEDKIL